MSKRVYVKGAKTHAKGESFKADERERFQVSIDLMSLKTLKDYDIMGWRGEFYFKVDGEKALKTRFPDVGTIKLQRNEEFTSKSDMNLYTQFKTLSTGEKNTIEAIESPSKGPGVRIRIASPNTFLIVTEKEI